MSSNLKDQKHVQEYWQDVENKILDEECLNSEFQHNDPEYQIGQTPKSRRSFLKILGFTFTALPMASCMRIPVKKALPFLKKTDKVIPGVANWYATSLDPIHGASLLVKTREGRPIKIEGNPLHPYFQGGTFARDQGVLLSLYSSHRYTGPTIDGNKVEWREIDKELKKAFEYAAQRDGESAYVVIPPQSSPSSLKLLEKLKQIYPFVKIVTYAPAFPSAILEAHRNVFDSYQFPRFDLTKSDVVVSFSADFLGTWPEPVTMTKQYSKSRDILSGKKMLRHIQFESLMSLTGSNADERITLTPQEEANFIVNLLAYLQKKVGQAYLPLKQKLPETNASLVAKIGEELMKASGRSLVMCGSRSVEIQTLICAINDILGNYGKTLKVFSNDYVSYPVNSDFEKLQSESQSNKVSVVIFCGVNPLYDYHDQTKLEAALSLIKYKISFALGADETSQKCNVIAPMNHALESWNDYFQAPNVISFSQPVIQPLYGSRMWQESLLGLINFQGDYYSYIRENHKITFYPKQKKSMDFDSYWNQSVHDGVSYVDAAKQIKYKFDRNKTIIAFSKISKLFSNITQIALVTYEKVGIGPGDMTDNPWLQELPDPITKATWDNYLMIAPALARDIGVKGGDIVEVTSANNTIKVPVLLQPGTAKNTVGLALGYGRRVCGKAGLNVGVNAYGFLQQIDNKSSSVISNVQIKKTEERRAIAQTQTHHSMEGRDIVRETTLANWKNDPKAGQKPGIEIITMWEKHNKTGQQWAMAIDLSKCTGCSGCVISCHSENNVPVVGREEVLARRDMHWIRIDRYYKGDENQPEVVHQPVMCQHCDNAPCETVCPVLATVQSSDGLNQQVYNRCVGTRYCANNCPYKVRRFNWFDYPRKDVNENMTLNPDVVVRSRGVMEKCSMCVQRIQEGRLSAKKSRDEFSADNVKTACQQSCPADAIVFGDLNDKNGRLYKLMTDPRNYRLLDELNLQTRVNYLVKVRNKG